MTTKALSFSPLGPVSLPLLRINKILASSSGTDKVFMTFCYFSKVLNYALSKPQLGGGGKQSLVLADKLTKLAAFAGDARVLLVRLNTGPEQVLIISMVDTVYSVYCPFSAGFNR